MLDPFVSRILRVWPFYFVKNASHSLQFLFYHLFFKTTTIFPFLKVFCDSFIHLTNIQICTTQQNTSSIKCIENVRASIMYVCTYKYRHKWHFHTVLYKLHMLLSVYIVILHVSFLYLSACLSVSAWQHLHKSIPSIQSKTNIQRVKATLSFNINLPMLSESSSCLWEWEEDAKIRYNGCPYWSINIPCLLACLLFSHFFRFHLTTRHKKSVGELYCFGFIIRWNLWDFYLIATLLLFLFLSTLCFSTLPSRLSTLGT